MSKIISKNKKILLKICIISIFSALYFLLNMLTVKFGNYLQISLNALPIILISIFLGPVSGMAVGFIGEFLSQILEYGLSISTLWWTTPAVLRGLSVGLLFILFNNSQKIVPLSINIITSSLLVTILNTFLLIMESKILGYYAITLSTTFFVTRLTSSIATAVVMIVIIYPVINALKKQNLINILK